MISLNQNNISFISVNAFDFTSQNDKIMLINLRHSKLDQPSFVLNCFSNFKRPIKLYLNNSKITYLDQMFKSFLNPNQLNLIGITKVNFNEKHFKNRWTKRMYNKRIILIYYLKIMNKIFVMDTQLNIVE